MTEMKRTALSLLLSLLLFLGGFLGISSFAADNPAFSTQLQGEYDEAVTSGGQHSLVLDWRIKANRVGLNLNNAQVLCLAYDNTVLQIMKWDGELISDADIGTNLKSVSQTGKAGVYNYNVRVYAAHDSVGGVGYLCLALGDPYEIYACPVGSYLSLLKVRFAFRNGKSDSDLTAGSIRIMTAVELQATAQSTVMRISTDENGGTFYDYLRQMGGVPQGGDTLNAPVITYPGENGQSVEDDGAFGETSIPSDTENPSDSASSGPRDTDLPSGSDPQGLDPPAVSDFVNPYTDVKEIDWYYPAVKYATENSLMDGTGNGRFSPGMFMTRAMFAAVLHRLAGRPAADGAPPFTDVPGDQWFSQAINWASATEIINGYGGGRFGPNDNITREQAVTILYRYMAKIGMDVNGRATLSQYTDTGRISDWALTAMQWAVHDGVISGRSAATLVPAAYMTRAEVARIFYNIGGDVP